MIGIAGLLNDAAFIKNTPSGNISSVSVQSALNELDTIKVSTSDVTTSASANKLLRLNSSGVLPASITGTASGLTNARSITLTGLISGTTSFDGSQNVSITTTGIGGVADDVQFNNSGVFGGATNVKIKSGDLVLQDNSNITAPTSGVKLSSKIIAGRSAPVATSKTGFSSILQSSISRQKICWWNPPGNSSSIPRNNRISTTISCWYRHGAHSYNNKRFNTCQTFGICFG